MACPCGGETYRDSYERCSMGGDSQSDLCASCLDAQNGYRPPGPFWPTSWRDFFVGLVVWLVLTGGAVSITLWFSMG